MQKQSCVAASKAHITSHIHNPCKGKVANTYAKQPICANSHYDKYDMCSPTWLARENLNVSVEKIIVLQSHSLLNYAASGIRKKKVTRGRKRPSKVINVLSDENLQSLADTTWAFFFYQPLWNHRGDPQGWLKNKKTSCLFKKCHALRGESALLRE